MVYLISSVLAYKFYWSIKKLDQPKRRSGKFYRRKIIN